MRYNNQLQYLGQVVNLSELQFSAAYVIGIGPRQENYVKHFSCVLHIASVDSMAATVITFNYQNNAMAIFSIH